MNLWFEVVYEKKGFWIFNSYKGHDIVKAESAVDALAQVKVPSGWRVRLVQPVSREAQLALNKIEELKILQKKLAERKK